MLLKVHNESMVLHMKAIWLIPQSTDTLYGAWPEYQLECRKFHTKSYKGISSIPSKIINPRTSKVAPSQFTPEFNLFITETIMYY